MEIKIEDIIRKEIDELNIISQQAAKITNKDFKPFTWEDYTYLKDSQNYFGVFSLPFFLSYSILKDMEYRIQEPYKGAIWYWKKDSDSDKTVGFLPMQSKLIYDTLDTYITLLKSEKYFQALIIFRSYIEYTSQLYASLLDYDFFQKYSNSDELDESFKQLWFSSLKPSKVLSQIKNMHKEINQLLKEEKIIYGKHALYRRMFHPFDSELRGMLYGSLSSLAHGSYPALTKNDDAKLYSLVWLCTIYLVESQAVIDELIAFYVKRSPKELFTKWITLEIYLKSREPNTILKY